MMSTNRRLQNLLNELLQGLIVLPQPNFIL